MSRQTYNLVERIIIALMLVGMVGMFQPFAGMLFGYSFMLLLFSTLSFIIVSHLVPK
jgi:uncharacterized membrane protein YkgB